MRVAYQGDRGLHVRLEGGEGTRQQIECSYWIFAATRNHKLPYDLPTVSKSDSHLDGCCGYCGFSLKRDSCHEVFPCVCQVEAWCSQGCKDKAAEGHARECQCYMMMLQNMPREKAIPKMAIRFLIRIWSWGGLEALSSAGKCRGKGTILLDTSVSGLTVDEYLSRLDKASTNLAYLQPSSLYMENHHADVFQAGSMIVSVLRNCGFISADDIMGMNKALMDICTLASVVVNNVFDYWGLGTILSAGAALLNHSSCCSNADIDVYINRGQEPSMTLDLKDDTPGAEVSIAYASNLMDLHHFRGFWCHNCKKPLS